MSSRIPPAIKKKVTHYWEGEMRKLCPIAKDDGPCGEYFTMEEFANHIPHDHTPDEIYGAVIGMIFITHKSVSEEYKVKKK